jgi:CAAX prenyl protease-like protein
LSIIEKAAFPRIAPFAIFMAFIGVEEGLRFMAGRGVIAVPPQMFYFIYPVKALTVAIVLFLLIPRCPEVDLKRTVKSGLTAASLLTGLIVFALWVNMAWSYGTIGNPQGFNPNLLSNDMLRFFLTMTRFAGAVLVVPVMEELFWRSFIIRWIVDQDFVKVPIGRFTWPSFLISSVLFGLEHNLFLAGIMAGAAYNLLLYYSRSLTQCIVAHGISNLALGIYVLVTGKWFFW